MSHRLGIIGPLIIPRVWPAYPHTPKGLSHNWSHPTSLTAHMKRTPAPLKRLTLAYVIHLSICLHNTPRKDSSESALPIVMVMSST